MSNIQVLQTTEYQKLNRNPDDDDSETGHGTAVASKAVGSVYGLAKTVSVTVSASPCVRHSPHQNPPRCSHECCTKYLFIGDDYASEIYR